MKDAILKAALLSRVYQAAEETPLDFAPVLSLRLENHVFLKREDLQPVFSFKIRGAYNKMSSLNAEELGRGVIASSAGNHAQGVALSAQKLGCRAVIVMPVTTPEIKVAAVKNLGAEVVLIGDSYDSAYLHARELEGRLGLVFIHPYDDPDVIAGQGTIGIEILRQLGQPLDAVFVPIGGGGLIAGIGAVIKELRPGIRIIGVQAEESNGMSQSLRAGEPDTLASTGRFADGVAVKRIGDQTFEIAKQVIDHIVSVTNDEICAAIKDVFEDRRCILEPSGALAVAGLKRYVADGAIKGQCLIAIASGANINFDTLRHVSERAEVGEDREAIFAVTIPEEPGSFLEFCRTLGNRGVTEFNYRYEGGSDAHVFVGVRIRDRSESEGILARLLDQGYPARDLTDNEIAKLHIRHMVGGRANAVDERLFQVSFPERPGALLEFLEKMSSKWNISLFHYRSHGSEFGRVLMGVQVPFDERASFSEFLVTTGYEHEDVTEDKACELFLR